MKIKHYKIRTMTRQELEDVAISWAAKEGWNPGLYDTDSFYKTDPHGFFIGHLGDEPISCISAISYDGKFGFLGFYIVKPEYRGKGYGIQVWNVAMKYLDGQNIGLDGVVTQQENYKKSGFKLAYRNIRHKSAGTEDEINDQNVIPLSQVSFGQLVEYDKQMFPTPRPIFLKEWIKQLESLAVGYIKDRKSVGYGMVRKCRTGFKVGPLFADSPEIVDKLFQKMRSFAGKDTPIFFDTPEVNKEAVKLAEKYKMRPIFETARMYIKKKPSVALNKVFGVTTFELG